MPEIVWYQGYRYIWCGNIIEDMTRDFTHRLSLDEVTGAGAVVVLKADHIQDDVSKVDQVDRDLRHLKWLVLIVTANEEGRFQCDRMKHPNAKLWLQIPHPYQEADRYIPCGYPPDTIPLIRELPMGEKPLDWFFAGQVTHIRRELCMRQLRELQGGLLHETEGFTLGMPHSEYYKAMVAAKVVPCPGGPCTPDTFRVCEALEAGCIPVLDSASPQGRDREFWARIYGPNCPFPIIQEWDEFPGLLHDLLREWPSNANEMSAFYQQWKRQLRLNLMDDIQAVSNGG